MVKDVEHFIYLYFLSSKREKRITEKKNVKENGKHEKGEKRESGVKFN
jgi:hypothetical protein